MLKTLIKPMLALAMSLVALASAPATNAPAFHCGIGEFHAVDCNNQPQSYSVGYCD
jgi:hypothetical protein